MKTLFRVIILFNFIALSANALWADGERIFKVINAANDLADNSAQVVVCTKTGRMIISTLGSINFYDGSTFSHIETQQDYQYQLPLYQGNYHLYFDHMHHIWLKDRNKVTCVDLLSEKFVANVDSVIRNVFGYTDQVLDMFCDSIGNAWLLTENGLLGVDQNRTYTVLRDRNLQDVEVYSKKLLLTFYDNGEEVGQDINTGSVVHRTKAYDWNDAEVYSSSSVLECYDNYYFQIRNGKNTAILMRFDVSTLQWKTIMKTPFHLNDMAVDTGSHKLYIASEYGYYIYDIETEETNHVEELSLVTGKKLLTDCNTLCFDKQGGIWIGTEKRGLLYARPSGSYFNSYGWEDPLALKYAMMMDPLVQNITEFNGKQANCMYTDSRGWSWFGTVNGLYLYKTPKSEPIVFTKKNGLINEVIHAVVEDSQHNIWMSTSCGISCVIFEGEKPVFVNSFGQAENVPNESFVNCKAMRLADGTIIMQSIDHVISFNPKDFEKVNLNKDLKLYPKLVKLLVNGNFVIPGKMEDDNIIIDRAITRTKHIYLNANQNSISLTFTGLNYFRPLQTFYRVKVKGKGISEQWKVYSYYQGDGIVDSKGMLHLPLAGLQPGDYYVCVQASMYPDSWTEEPFEWVIHVHQPWWRTTGVYIILLILVTALLGVNFYYYNKNTKMRARRNNVEGDMVRKIRSFVDRCDSYSGELLAPENEEIYGGDSTNANLTPEFIKLMMSLLPYINSHKTKELTMHTMSKICDMDVISFYDILSSNMYKSPRKLILLIRLHKAADMLISTNKTIEKIADECGFYTPNYFIGSFFHEYKLTPGEFREEKQNKV